MSELKKDMKPVIVGWYSVRFKSKLNLKEQRDKDVVSSFIDWAFFDGKDWDIHDYRKLGFYVFNIIKLEQEVKK